MSQGLHIIVVSARQLKPSVVWVCRPPQYKSLLMWYLLVLWQSYTHYHYRLPIPKMGVISLAWWWLCTGGLPTSRGREGRGPLGHPGMTLSLDCEDPEPFYLGVISSRPLMYALCRGLPLGMYSHCSLLHPGGGRVLVIIEHLTMLHASLTALCSTKTHLITSNL